jgi:diketogulonate reductase-like aldo/keto reductase
MQVQYTLRNPRRKCMLSRMGPSFVRGVAVPAFLYGTAWKESRTTELASQALSVGFRGIDTANQRRHYVEAAVGDAVATAIQSGGVSRTELFLQTKFTYAAGQDERIPYDLAAAPAAQVRQSFESSLDHLKTDYVDAYVLHGPSSRYGFGKLDWDVWRAMEALHQAKKARLLGVSNVSLEQLTVLERDAGVKPAFVQNRCFAATGWDRDVRAFCSAKDIRYQGFSLLTANARALASPLVRSVAERTGFTVAQVVFAFARGVGMLPLTGTSDEAHMKEDLASLALELSPADLHAIERVSN